MKMFVIKWKILLIWLAGTRIDKNKNAVSKIGTSQRGVLDESCNGQTIGDECGHNTQTKKQIFIPANVA